MFSGFDGLMTLSRREGVDIRPTLLRVLTDLYVQTSVHTVEEEQQFVELASRLIDRVDDATRAAVRARLSIYPRTPQVIRQQLAMRTGSWEHADRAASASAEPVVDQRPAPPPIAAAARQSSAPRLQPDEGADISDAFFAADATERRMILKKLAKASLKPSARVPEPRAARAIATLEKAAFASDIDTFTSELGSALLLPASIAGRVVNDESGEPLACAAKALGMPSEIFQRVVMFLDPRLGSSVAHVYRMARFYDALSERSCLILLSAWREATVAATRAKYRPALYDDERQRPRSASAQFRSFARAQVDHGEQTTKSSGR